MLTEPEVKSFLGVNKILDYDVQTLIRMSGINRDRACQPVYASLLTLAPELF